MVTGQRRVYSGHREAVSKGHFLNHSAGAARERQFFERRIFETEFTMAQLTPNVRRSEVMNKRTFYRASYLGVVIVLGVLLATTLAGVRAAQNNGGAVRVGNADIGGVV